MEDWLVMLWAGLAGLVTTPETTLVEGSGE